MSDESQFFKEMARKDLLSFSVYCDRNFEIENHHKLIAEHLEKVLTGEIQNLIIEMPPRAGKSRIMQEFIAKVYGDNPNTDILYTGHSLNLLEGFSRNIRNRINSIEYKSIYGTRISGESSAVKNWNIDKGGEFAIYGVGGGITGKGGNCILGGELVLTNRGMVDIIDVVLNPSNYLVLSYDHKSSKPEYRRIISTRKLKSDDVYKIKTDGGNVIHATGKHEFFIIGQGYKAVELMKETEGIIIHETDSKMRQLLKGLQEARIGDTEEVKDRIDTSVLFQEMHLRTNCMKQMQEMPGNDSRKEMKDLCIMQDVKKKNGGYTMQGVLKDNETIKSLDEILLNGVQEQKPLEKNEMKGELELQALTGKERLSEGVLQDEENNICKGYELHSLPFGNETGSPSQRQEPDEQFGNEFSNGLPILSPETPSIKEDSISTIERIEGEYDVYDIQVEGNQNFFCNSILVHNCLIIDDPYASRQDAESETVRRTVSDWYWSTLITRKQNDRSKQIIIMQRWREDDLVGEILEREGSKWTELKIPALDDNDESFWPSRFSSDYFKEIRASNPIFFSSQYQQDPVNKGGGDFRSEYFTYCDNLEVEARQSRMDIVTFVDPAISQKQEADFTALVTIGTDSVSNNVYLLECKQLKAEPGEIINEIFATSDKYKNAGRSYRLGIETIQYQKMLFLEVQNQMRMRDKYFTLEDVKPSGEKNARIRSILQPRYSSRSIIHPKDLNGLGALELELLKFPNGKHDDLIDAMSSALSIAQVNNVRKQTIITPNYI